MTLAEIIGVVIILVCIIVLGLTAPPNDWFVE